MPANDIIHIPVIVSKPDEIQMNLYDIEGRHYKSMISTINSTGMNNIEVPVAELTKGIYFIYLQNKEGYRVTRKIIVG